MSNQKVRCSLVIVVMALSFSTLDATAATTKILHNFTAADGSHPFGVTLGPDGHIYGVTVIGATAGGTAFELVPTDAGTWHEAKRLNFGTDAYFPNAMTFYSDGDLYGVTELGSGGCGTFFKLSHNEHGHLVRTVLHVLPCSEGLYAQAALVQDSSGNFYGTAWGGGEHGFGSVFELSPVGDGTWTLSVLHSFIGTDGDAPMSAVVIDAAGNLYGTTLCGGTFPEVKTRELRNCNSNQGPGTVWELSPLGGTWTFTTLYNFTGHDDGGNPSSGGALILDAAGNLYGTTHNGGARRNYGTVFELSPNGDGTWSEKVLHSFNGPGGISPSGGLIADAAGNLYGEAFGPGSYLGFGGEPESGGQLVYQLSPNGDGSWSETILHFFHYPANSGPAMGLTMDSSGNLYGTTWQGGTNGDGVVFEITP